MNNEENKYNKLFNLIKKIFNKGIEFSTRNKKKKEIWIINENDREILGIVKKRNYLFIFYKKIYMKGSKIIKNQQFPI